MVVQNSSMSYLQDLGTAYVPNLFRSLMYVGTQYNHNRDDCGGKDLANNQHPHVALDTLYNTCKKVEFVPAKMAKLPTYTRIRKRSGTYVVLNF